MTKKANLGKLRSDLYQYITDNYDSVEAFCWDKELCKATVSNFLNDKKDFQLSTLVKLAHAMDCELVVIALPRHHDLSGR